MRDGVAADLATANQHLTQLAADLGGPPQNLDQAEAAFNELAALFTAVDAAVAKVATVVPEVGTVEQALIALVKKAVAAVGDGVSGLVDQLGLGPGGASLSDGLASSGQKITYQLANSAERSVAGPPRRDPHVLASYLSAALDYGALPPVLSVALTTGLGIGLIADGFVETLFGGGGGEGAAPRRSASPSASTPRRD